VGGSYSLGRCFSLSASAAPGGCGNEPVIGGPLPQPPGPHQTGQSAPSLSPLACGEGFHGWQASAATVGGWRSGRFVPRDADHDGGAPWPGATASASVESDSSATPSPPDPPLAVWLALGERRGLR